MISFPPGYVPENATLATLTILRRMTDAEKFAFFGSDDPVVVVFRGMFLAAGKIDPDDPDTVSALAYFESIGLIGEGRAQELLAP